MKINLSHILALTCLGACVAILWWKNKPEDIAANTQRPKLGKHEFSSSDLKSDVQHQKQIQRAKNDLPQEELQMSEEEIAKIKTQKNVGDGVSDSMLASIENIELERQRMLREEVNLSEAEIVAVFNTRLKYQTQIDNLRLENDGQISYEKLAEINEKRDSELSSLIGSSTLLRLNDFEKTIDDKILQASTLKAE